MNSYFDFDAMNSHGPMKRINDVTNLYCLGRLQPSLAILVHHANRKAAAGNKRSHLVRARPSSIRSCMYYQVSRA